MSKKYIPKHKLYSPEQEQYKIAPLSKEHTDAFAQTFSHYDTFATFTFTNGATITEENALVLLRLFLNEVDKAYFGNNAARKNIRVEREVFIHRTQENGRYIHFHIWFNSLGHKEIFNTTLTKLWEDNLYNAGKAEVVSWIGSQYYGWREDWGNLGLHCWLQDYGHRDTGTHQYKAQQQQLTQATLNRLYKIHRTGLKEINIKEYIQANKTKRLKQDTQRQWDNKVSKTRQNIVL